MLSGIYIITASGLPLYTHNQNREGANLDDSDILFSGLITAIQKFLGEIQVGEAQNFNTETFTVHIKSEAKCAYVFLTDKKETVTDIALNSLHKKLSDQVNPLLDNYNEQQMLNNNELKSFLTIAVQGVLTGWEKDQKESTATKEAKESLW